MRIHKVVEQQDGTKVTFQGVLEGPELAFVLEYGLNMLMKEGALPFVSRDSFTELDIMESPELEQ